MKEREEDRLTKVGRKVREGENGMHVREDEEE